MDVINESIVKFIEALITDDYATASKHLTTVVNEKVKGRIKKASSIPVFESTKKKGKKAPLAVKRKKTGAAVEEKEMPAAKDSNKNWMKGVTDKNKEKSKSFKEKLKSRKSK